MAARIKGITIRIDGDATPLTTALKSVDRALNQTKRNINDLNRALRLDPGNTELLKDKQQELARAINETEQKLVKEREAYRELQAADRTPENVEKMRQLKTQIDLDTAALNELKKEAAEASSVLGTQMQLAGQKIQEVGGKIQDVGRKISGLGQTMTTYVTMPIAGAFAASIKSAIDWESAFTGVMKTVDETATTTYDDLKKSINEIAKTTASTQNEVAAVMEIGGQLGVIADDLPEFAKTMIMLGDTTNLSAEEAASSIAKFSNITGTAISDSDKLGAVIVDLGNNFATTEADIMAMSMRLAGAGKQIGLTDGEILGLATALSSVGIEAEMGGSAFSKAMIKMQVAVETGFDQVNRVTARTKMSLRDLELMSQNDTKGFKELAGSLGMTKGELTNLVKAGTNLEDFARISGTTVDEFVQLYRNDSVAALQAFIQGLGDTEGAGESTIAMLQEMGFTEVRLRDTLTRLASSGDLVTNAVAKGNDAWSDNSALTTEAEKRYATMQSKLNQLKARLTEVATTIGETLMPHLEQMMGYIEDLTDKWNELTEAQQGFILKAAGVAAVVGPVLMVVGSIISAIGTIVSSIGSLVSWLGSLMSAFAGVEAAGSAASGALAAISGPIAVVVGIIAAYIAAFTLFFQKNEEFRNLVIEIWENIKTAFTTAFESIQAWLTGIPEWFAPIIAAVSEFGQALFGVYNEALTQIINFINEHRDQIMFVVNTIELFFKNKFEFLKTYLTIVLNYIREIIVGVLGIITNVYKAFTAALRGDWQAALHFLAQAAITAWHTIRNIFTNTINSIKEMFTHLKENFKEWGGDMIANFVQGIKDKIGDVKEAVSGIGQAIAERIHFTEPDVGPLSNFHTWAPDMMALFAQGITDNASLITDAVNKSFNIKPIVVNPNVIQSQAQQTPVQSGPIAVNVTLEGDANRLYRVVRAEAVRNHQITGMSFA